MTRPHLIDKVEFRLTRETRSKVEAIVRARVMAGKPGKISTLMRELIDREFDELSPDPVRIPDPDPDGGGGAL